MPVEGIRFDTLPFAECADTVRAFRNSQREAGRDSAYFDWRYARRPAGLPAHVTLGYEGDRVIAAASLIPHEFNVAGATCMAGMVGDISVDASMRGRGVAAALLTELKDAALARGLDACFVLPNREVTGALLRAGFKQVGTIYRVVRLVSLRRPLAARAGAAGGVLGAGLDGVLSFIEEISDGRPPQGYAATTTRRFDGRYDELWRRLPRVGVALARRDAAWLTWRFLDKPDAGYRIFELTRSGTLVGYLVYHLEDRRLWVDDFLAIDAEAGRWLAVSFLKHVRTEGLADSLHIRSSATTALASPWHGTRYLRRADTQAVMWIASPRIPQAPHWFVTAADKDV